VSKTRNKGHNDAENTRGYIRELEKEIRSLRQELRRYEKYDRAQREQDSSDHTSDNEDTSPNLLMTKNCDSCGKGKIIQTLEICGKIYGTCGTCGHNDRIS
jgi:hypothetical protein